MSKSETLMAYAPDRRSPKRQQDDRRSSPRWNTEKLEYEECQWNNAPRILQLLSGGMTITQLAARFHCSYGTIWRIVQASQSKARSKTNG
jgi:hypothetical protein